MPYLHSLQFKYVGLLSLVLTLPAWAALKVGEPAPNFSLKNQNGKAVTLAQFKGKPVLIYFYPKDETPGCTKEACTLRDEYAKFEKLGTVILGVSVQNAESHKAFIKNQRLPFDLLVDEGGKVAKNYGVGNYPGTNLLERKSVLVGPDQKVWHLYNDVDPSAHASEVLKDIAAAKSKS